MVYIYSEVVEVQVAILSRQLAVAIPSEVCTYGHVLRYLLN